MANQPNQFNARSDAAAQALKATMKDARTGEQVKPRGVPVDADGQPARPLPPEGSYARMAIERQRREAAANRPDLQHQLEQQPDVGQQTLPQGDPNAQQEQPQVADQLTPNVQRRFSELTQLIRQKDQELQQQLVTSKQLQESNAQTQKKLAEIEQRYQQLVQTNLETLDPDTRQQVLSDVRFQESMAEMESRLMAKFAPTIQSVANRAAQAELEAVAGKYTRFDLQVHGPLIEMFRERNPNCSVEQAFRAIAEPEELIGNQNGRAAAIPPVAIPRNGNAAPRYVPAEPKTTPEQELDQDRQRAFQLARSDKPEDKRFAGRAMDQFIKAKLGDKLPGQPNNRRG
jgi:hypothetical protein